MNIVIIAGSGAIGNALIRYYLKKFSTSMIHATFNTNKPQLKDTRLNWSKLNLLNERSIEQFASSFVKVDILINAAGILHDEKHMPEKTIRHFDGDFFHKNIAIHVTASLYLAKYFQKALKTSEKSYFVVLSAKVGSIFDNKIGGWISYRVSKAALNMAIKTISIEWKRTVSNCCVIAFHPGATVSQLSKPFKKNIPAHKLHSPDATAALLAQTIDTHSHHESGCFLDYNANILPW